MTRKILKILAVNPGSRYLGIAVFYGADLKDWRMKNISGSDMNQRLKKARNIVSKYIDWFDPDILAIKRLHPSRSSSNLSQLTSGIKRLARSRGMKVYQYTIDEMKAFFMERKRSNKQGLSEILVSRYPVLVPEFNKERENANPYYMRMFEAVALGAICSYQSG
jgi:Holliday junction resolvasome RuvABC endonuclease subunit